MGGFHSGSKDQIKAICFVKEAPVFLLGSGPVEKQTDYSRAISLGSRWDFHGRVVPKVTKACDSDHVCSYPQDQLQMCHWGAGERLGKCCQEGPSIQAGQRLGPDCNLRKDPCGRQNSVCVCSFTLPVSWDPV